MGEGKEEDLYHKFSRKDLQGLCKKYGLPATKSNSEMGTSLILYLEQKNISSKIIWEVSRSDPNPSVWSEHQPGLRRNSAGLKRTDLREMASNNGFGQFQKHQDRDQHVLHCIKGPASSGKASEDMSITAQLHKDSNSGAGDPENAFPFVLSSTGEAPPPSFMFQVSNMDGIQLDVDLNSTATDWAGSLNAGVTLCLDIQDHKSSSPEQRKGSCLKDSHNETNNTQLEDESCPTTMGTSLALQADEFGGEGPLSIPGLKSFTNVHNLRDLGAEPTLLSSKSKSDTELQICGSETLVIKENKVGTYSDASVVTQNRTYKSSENTMPYDPNSSKTGDGIYKKPRSQKTINPPDLAYLNRILSGAPFGGIKTSPSGSFVQYHDTVSSSRVDACLVSDDQPQNSRVAQTGPHNSSHVRGNVNQTWPVQAIDVNQIRPVQAIDGSQNASSSFFLSGLSGAGQINFGRPSILSTRHVAEAQTDLVSSFEKTRPLFPFQRSSLTNLNFGTSIEKGKVGFVSSHEPGQKVIELPKKNASLGPSNIGGPLDFAAPNKNRLDNRITNHLNKLDEDIRRSEVRNNLGSSKTGAGNESSGLLSFTQSSEPEEPRIKPAYSELKMQEHLRSVDESQAGSPEAKILGTSMQFSGHARVTRRRSRRIAFQ